MIKFGVLLSILTTSANLLAQTYTANFKTIAPLPKEVSESSGIIKTKNGTYWTHGDGGNSSEIYEFNDSGTLLRTLAFFNASNIDWEDITQDDSGNIWLGDVGNNDSDRDNLKLYKVQNPSKHDSLIVHTGILNISYPDQIPFPSPISNRNFDVEGIAFYKDSILLVTKNRSFPNSGFSKIYKVPAQTGVAVAELIDSIFTETHIQLGRITAADYSAKEQLLMLSALHQIYKIRFNGAKIKPEHIIRYRFPYHSNQFEGLTYLGGDSLILTAEKPSQLFKVYLKDTPFIYPLGSSTHNTTGPKVYKHTIQFPENFKGKVQITLFDTNGKTVWNISEHNPERVSIPDKFQGLYYLRVSNLDHHQTQVIFLP